ncbi:MAG: uroporphyrinogen decarboxylase [Rickettsiales bacterium]|nr:uroporphyrinogen decarboxylase [Rickettsiales bacterium]
MYSSHKILVSTLMGKQGERNPFWFMRQAGRYLPEYRELRKTKKDFLAFCYSPQDAMEATLQPIKRFAMDGAIIFSDILVVPQALGAKLWFEEGHGPRLEPIRDAEGLARLSAAKVIEFLSPVYEALRITKKALPEETSLIGFVGAPWTLASYVVEGKSGSDFSILKTLAKQDTVFFSQLIDLLTEAVIMHAKEQIKSGAEIIQLFDSWAGVIRGGDYDRWVIEPTKKIVAALKTDYPEIPLVGFPRQSAELYKRYVVETKVDAVNVDNSVSLRWVREELQPLCVVQGNLDPQVLAGDKEKLVAEAAHILQELSSGPHVFNLGHGVIPQTPVENMYALCEFLRKAS